VRLLGQLVDLFRPSLEVSCPVCDIDVPRDEAIGGCCSIEHFRQWQDETAY
jgi:hypothetical protein